MRTRDGVRPPSRAPDDNDEDDDDDEDADEDDEDDDDDADDVEVDDDDDDAEDDAADSDIGRNVPRAPASVPLKRTERTRHAIAAARALGSDMCTANVAGSRCCSCAPADGVKRITHDDGGFDANDAEAAPGALVLLSDATSAEVLVV